MTLLKGSRLLRGLLLLIMCLGPVACSTTDSDQAQQQEAIQADQQESDQEFVYVDENGNEVSQEDISQENYEVVNIAEDQGQEVADDSDYSMDDQTEQELKDILNSMDGSEDVAAAENTMENSMDYASEEVNSMDMDMGSLDNTMDSAEEFTDLSAEVDSAPAEEYTDLTSDSSASADGFVDLNEPTGTSGSSSFAYNTMSSAEAAEAKASGSYVVRRGDTLSHIAYGLYGNANKWVGLAEASGFQNPHLIYPGDRVTIPGSGMASVDTYQETETYQTVEATEVIETIELMDNTVEDASMDVIEFADSPEVESSIQNASTNISNAVSSATTVSSDSSEWENLENLLDETAH